MVWTPYDFYVGGELRSLWRRRLHSHAQRRRLADQVSPGFNPPKCELYPGRAAGLIHEGDHAIRRGRFVVL